MDIDIKQKIVIHFLNKRVMKIEMFAQMKY